MRRRRLLAGLLQLATVAGLAGASGRARSTYAQTPPFLPSGSPAAPAGGDSAPGSTPPAPAMQRPAGDASANAEGTPNNIVGLNVARLRQDRYIEAAANLVNANGGDWGYITVVFTADERDLAPGEHLLSQFVDRCYEQHLQPIVRVSTTFRQYDGIWDRPAEDDAERWRAYLERGKWPTKRVWIIAGNEPNLGRDWGGEVDAAGYARYLSHFLDVFADSEQFKVVNAPLDASNGAELPIMQDAFEFLAEMDAAVPDIFERLPAWASNPYRVLGQGDSLRYTHLAYEAELDAIGRDMPVIITEAGHLDTGDDREIAAFYGEAFRDWMADPRVLAATPLFWHPDRGVYWMFDFDNSGKMTYTTPTYDLIRALPRVRGTPEYVPTMGNVARARPGWVTARARDARSAQSQAHTPTQTESAAILQIANTDGQGARLREEPARSARSLRVLPDGATVEAVGPEEDGEGLRWRPVRVADGTRGWIAASLLTPHGDDGD